TRRQSRGQRPGLRQAVGFSEIGAAEVIRSRGPLRRAIELIFRLLCFDHIRFIPFALAEPLDANHVNAFSSVLFHESDTLVLYMFDSVSGFEFWICHTSIL